MAKKDFQKNPTKGTKKEQVGVIVVTHSDYGSALLRAAEFILGTVQDCASIQVDSRQEVDETVNRLQEAISRLDCGMGVLILTDMFGGTPTNISLGLMNKNDNIDVLTGVNLPMLLRVLSNRDIPLAEISELAIQAGCEGIIAAGGVLRAKGKK